MLNLGAFQVCRFTHTSLLLFLLQFLLCVTINYPKIKTFCSNLLPSSLRGNGPKERSHLARTAETASAETRPLSGVKKKTPPPSPSQNLKGSRRAVRGQDSAQNPCRFASASVSTQGSRPCPRLLPAGENPALRVQVESRQGAELTRQHFTTTPRSAGMRGTGPQQADAHHLTYGSSHKPA